MTKETVDARQAREERAAIRGEARDQANEAAERERFRLAADRLGNEVLESENAIAAIRATGAPTLKQLADHAELVGRYQTARNKAERQ